MAQGRPAKKQKNTSGLRNQGYTTPSTSSAYPDLMDTDSIDELEDLGLQFDSTRVDWRREEVIDDGSDIDLDESVMDLDDLEDEEFMQRLVEMAMREDENDPDWVPARLRTRKGTKKGQSLAPVCVLLINFVNKGRPETYATGPDVMSKSVRTAQRYAKSWKGQTSLDNFNFRSTTLPVSLKPAVHAPFKNAPRMTRKHPAQKTLSPILMAAAPTTKISTIPCVRQASRSPSCGAISIVDSDEESRGGTGETAPRSDAELERIEAECEELPLVEEDAEAWEEELDTNVQDPNVEIKSWDEHYPTSINS